MDVENIELRPRRLPSVSHVKPINRTASFIHNLYHGYHGDIGLLTLQQCNITPTLAPHLIHQEDAITCYGVHSHGVFKVKDTQ